MNFNYSIEEHAGFFLSCHFRFAGWIGAIYVHDVETTCSFPPTCSQETRNKFCEQIWTKHQTIFCAPHCQ